jgi:hypothetical protein
MIAAAVSSALATVNAAPATAPATAPVNPAPSVKRFNANKAPENGESLRGDYYAIAIGCGELSGIFRCSDNYNAYLRALSVVNLVKGRGGKFAKGSNGKVKEWIGAPRDDNDTAATGRYICYLNKEEYALFCADNAQEIADLLNGGDGRGGRVKEEKGADTEGAPEEKGADTEGAPEEKEKGEGAPAPA